MYVLESKLNGVNLTVWAHAQGIHVQTAYRWCREETLPVPVQKVGRLILVSPQSAMEAVGKAEGAGLYARVSWHDRKSGLGGRVARLSVRAAEAGLPVARVEAGAGAGINRLRARVRGLLPGPAVTVMVAGHRDRLARVNTGLVEPALSAHRRRLVVLGNCEAAGDLAEVLTWLCARLAGGRPARNRVLKAAGCAQQDIGSQAVKLQASGGGG
jgi:putative resolvase